MDEEPTERLWVRIKEQTSMGDTVVAFCYRLSDQGNKHEESRRFLETIDDNFLTQVIEEPTRRCALLNLILAKKEGLVRDMKLKGSFGCSDGDVQDPIRREQGKKQDHNPELQESRL
ncbi:mast stem cell growth factor receptor kit [Limosa lapponica baueri]|uniref:Mast stem cell growth factor receptor kit n=1 Tax=Limosa lapponica baueri TaxID=1758121 RepID=A0A2I0UP94_LIMLA|nr:mast stem cell growth factor receptor kit [Limosa lapponica baueri]